MTILTAVSVGWVMSAVGFDSRHDGRAWWAITLAWQLTKMANKLIFLRFYFTHCKCIFQYLHHLQLYILVIAIKRCSYSLLVFHVCKWNYAKIMRSEHKQMSVNKYFFSFDFRQQLLGLFDVQQFQVVLAGVSRHKPTWPDKCFSFPSKGDKLKVFIVSLWSVW